MRSTYPLAKRALDVTASIAGLVILSPVLLGCGLVIRLTSPGPVLFSHRRVGRHGRPFELLKFRTMVDRSVGAQVTSAGDPWITRVGRTLRKYKLDELPQLINVARGEMSLVGPRPEVQRYVDCYPERYARVLEVRPG